MEVGWSYLLEPGCPQKPYVCSAPLQMMDCLVQCPCSWAVSLLDSGVHHRKPTSTQIQATLFSISFSSDQDAFALHPRDSHLSLV